MPGYFLNVSAIVPTAYGRGSTSSAAPSLRASTVPAPIFISPCVSVGPSSTTSARLPGMRSGWSTVSGDAASMTIALGLTAADVPAHDLDRPRGRPSRSC